MKERFLISSLAASLALGLLSAAPDVRAEDEWSGQVTPYIWFTGAGGTVRPFTGAPTIQVDASFSDLFKDLNFAFFVSGFARKGDFVLLGDFSTASASRSGTVLVPGVGPAPARGSFSQTSLTLSGGLRVVEDEDISVDALAGVRVMWLRGSVDVAGGAISRSPEKNVLDPLIALRVNARTGGNSSILVYLDYGGFGVGSESTWQFVGTYNFQASEDFFLSLGYRYMAVDYRSGGTQLDMRLGGPLIGATWRF